MEGNVDHRSKARRKSTGKKVVPTKAKEKNKTKKNPPPKKKTTPSANNATTTPSRKNQNSPLRSPRGTGKVPPPGSVGSGRRPGLRSNSTNPPNSPGSSSSSSNSDDDSKTFLPNLPQTQNNGKQNVANESSEPPREVTTPPQQPEDLFGDEENSAAAGDQDHQQNAGDDATSQMTEDTHNESFFKLSEAPEDLKKRNMYLYKHLSGEKKKQHVHAYALLSSQSKSTGNKVTRSSFEQMLSASERLLPDKVQDPKTSRVPVTKVAGNATNNNQQEAPAETNNGARSSSTSGGNQNQNGGSVSEGGNGNGTDIPPPNPSNDRRGEASEATPRSPPSGPLVIFSTDTVLQPVVEELRPMLKLWNSCKAIANFLFVDSSNVTCKNLSDRLVMISGVYDLKECEFWRAWLDDLAKCIKDKKPHTPSYERMVALGRFSHCGAKKKDAAHVYSEEAKNAKVAHKFRSPDAPEPNIVDKFKDRMVVSDFEQLNPVSVTETTDYEKHKIFKLMPGPLSLGVLSMFSKMSSCTYNRAGESKACLSVGSVPRHFVAVKFNHRSLGDESRLWNDDVTQPGLIQTFLGQSAIGFAEESLIAVPVQVGHYKDGKPPVAVDVHTCATLDGTNAQNDAVMTVTVSDMEGIYLRLFGCAFNKAYVYPHDQRTRQNPVPDPENDTVPDRVVATLMYSVILTELNKLCNGLATKSKGSDDDLLKLFFYLKSIVDPRIGDHYPPPPDWQIAYLWTTHLLHHIISTKFNALVTRKFIFPTLVDGQGRCGSLRFAAMGLKPESDYASCIAPFTRAFETGVSVDHVKFSQPVSLALVATLGMYCKQLLPAWFNPGKAEKLVLLSKLIQDAKKRSRETNMNDWLVDRIIKPVSNSSVMKPVPAEQPIDEKMAETPPRPGRLTQTENNREVEDEVAPRYTNWTLEDFVLPELEISDVKDHLKDERLYLTEKEKEEKAALPKTAILSRANYLHNKRNLEKLQSDLKLADIPDWKESLTSKRDLPKLDLEKGDWWLAKTFDISAIDKKPTNQHGRKEVLQLLMCVAFVVDNVGANTDRQKTLRWFKEIQTLLQNNAMTVTAPKQEFVKKMHKSRIPVICRLEICPGLFSIKSDGWPLDKQLEHQKKCIEHEINQNVPDFMGIFPRKKGDVPTSLWWCDPFFRIIFEPANWICRVMQKMVSHMDGNIAMKATRDKFLPCCFLSVLELLNTYGPVLPVPLFIRKTMPNFFHLMTLPNDICKERMQSNIPMFVAIVMFWFHRGQFLADECLQPKSLNKCILEIQSKGSPNPADVAEDPHSETEKWSKFFRLDMYTVMSHLKRSGEGVLNTNPDCYPQPAEGEPPLQPGLADMFCPRFYFGEYEDAARWRKVNVRSSTHKRWVGREPKQGDPPKATAYDRDGHVKAERLTLLELAKELFIHANSTYLEGADHFRFLDNSLQYFCRKKHFAEFFQKGVNSYPPIANLPSKKAATSENQYQLLQYAGLGYELTHEVTKKDFPDELEKAGKKKRKASEASEASAGAGTAKKSKKISKSKKKKAAAKAASEATATVEEVEEEQMLPSLLMLQPSEEDLINRTNASLEQSRTFYSDQTDAMGDRLDLDTYNIASVSGVAFINLMKAVACYRHVVNALLPDNQGQPVSMATPDTVRGIYVNQLRKLEESGETKYLHCMQDTLLDAILQGAQLSAQQMEFLRQRINIGTHSTFNEAMVLPEDQEIQNIQDPQQWQIRLHRAAIDAGARTAGSAIVNHPDADDDDDDDDDDDGDDGEDEVVDENAQDDDDVVLPLEDEETEQPEE